MSWLSSADDEWLKFRESHKIMNVLKFPET